MLHPVALLYATASSGPHLIALAQTNDLSALLTPTQLPEADLIWLAPRTTLTLPDRLALGTTLYQRAGEVWQAGEQTLTLQVRLTTDVQLVLAHLHEPWRSPDGLRHIPGATYFPKQQRLLLAIRLTLSVAPQLDVALEVLVQWQQQRARQLMARLSLPNVRPTLDLNTDIKLDLETHHAQEE